MKIAYFSPLSPIKSGISTYSEINLLPYLKKHCDIDIFIDKNYTPTNDYIKKNFKVNSYEKFDRKQYDAVLYHLGNNLYHEYIYNLLLKEPGIVVVHDPFISGLIWNSTIAKSKPDAYVEHMVYCLGEKGRKIAEYAISTNHYPDFDYPLIKKVADSSIAIIVHSDFAKKIVASEDPRVFLKKIKHPTPMIDVNLKVKKEDYKISNNNTVISTFGFVAQHKRLPIILKAFAKFSEKKPDCKFLIGGSFLEKNFENEINQLINELKISEKVIQTGFLENLIPYIQISDIIIQTRYPTAGETSGMTLEIMRMGKPVIVSNTGWFSELPDDVSIKIDVNNDEQKSIIDAFTKLSSDKNYRDRLASNAKKYVNEEHDPEKIAYEFIEFLSTISNSEQNKFVKNLSHHFKNLGIKHTDTHYMEHFSITLDKVLS